jgi:hypothetical protein
MCDRYFSLDEIQVLKYNRVINFSFMFKNNCALITSPWYRGALTVITNITTLALQ